MLAVAAGEDIVAEELKGEVASLKKELEKAISNPQKIDFNMVDAQQARRILDRLAGYIISPVLYKTLKGAQSAGRVQSVVVKIVLDKEKEIEKFYSNKSDTYFIINSDITMGEYEFNSKLYKAHIKNEEGLSFSFTNQLIHKGLNHSSLCIVREELVVLILEPI